jgi:hypothetical protein
MAKARTLCRHFGEQEHTRLNVSIAVADVDAIDRLLTSNKSHPARGCRSEFIRIAIAQQLQRERGVVNAAASEPPSKSQVVHLIER